MTQSGESDREILIRMLDRAGIKYHLVGEDELEVRVEDQPHMAKVGYLGFVAGFTFTEDGALQMIGAWE